MKSSSASTRSRVRPIGGAALAAAVTILSIGGEARGQTRVVLPEGTVLTVRTTAALSSGTARQGQEITTTVADTVRVDGYVAIPAGSRIQGVVSVAEAADDRRSGVLGLEFDRLVLPSGAAYAIEGRLTSTDPNERRRLESQPDARVVLVGGRGGAGAAIAGIGQGGGNDPFSGILGALGALLSEGEDVTVPAGTSLAVRLETGLVLRVAGAARPVEPDAFTIYTSREAIEAAQRELARRNYYRGPLNGTLDTQTQRALLEFQIDQRILATGNLDGRTAQALGLSLPGSTALTVSEASVVRRNAQVMAGRLRDALGIAATGRLDPRRVYGDGDLELWFALSAFADNAGLYEQVVRSSGHVQGVGEAGTALVEAAERVDLALAALRAPAWLTRAWANVQADLRLIDPGYGS